MRAAPEVRTGSLPQGVPEETGHTPTPRKVQTPRSGNGARMNAWRKPMNEAPRKFRKSKNRMICGVCAGIADWLGWDARTGRFFYVLVSVMSVIVPGILI